MNRSTRILAAAISAVLFVGPATQAKEYNRSQAASERSFADAHRGTQRETADWTQNSRVRPQEDDKDEEVSKPIKRELEDVMRDLESQDKLGNFEIQD